MSQPLIRVSNLSKTYVRGELRVEALKGVSLEIAHGEFVAIMGSSGSGKSTFMNTVGCLDRPTSGSYLLGDVEVATLDNNARAELRNKTLGFVFQGFHLLARTSAIENVELPLVYQGVPSRERRARAMKALESVGLAARFDHTPNQLSGGQQQRVAIARAIVNEPSLLLADEPTGNLDTKTSVEVMALLQNLCKTRAITIVLVTHEPDIARYTQRVVTFRDGRILSDVPVTDQRDAAADLLSEHP
jgi:putative ABC transport system ATP-binding protein